MELGRFLLEFGLLLGGGGRLLRRLRGRRRLGERRELTACEKWVPAGHEDDLTLVATGHDASRPASRRPLHEQGGGGGGELGRRRTAHRRRGSCGEQRRARDRVDGENGVSPAKRRSSSNAGRQQRRTPHVQGTPGIHHHDLRCRCRQCREGWRHSRDSRRGQSREEKARSDCEGQAHVAHATKVTHDAIRCGCPQRPPRREGGPDAAPGSPARRRWRCG